MLKRFTRESIGLNSDFSYLGMTENRAGSTSFGALGENFKWGLFIINKRRDFLYSLKIFKKYNEE